MAQPTPPSMVSFAVRSGDLDLAAWQGARTGPTLVFVHGFPDTHTVWQQVIDRLADRFHCAAYDVRGAGASDAPASRGGYELAALVSDLVAVLDTLDDDESVHLVGHDWGSVQLWEAVFRATRDPRLNGRIASYTSISGPALGHLAAFVRSAGKGGWRRRRDVLVQQLRSWYVWAFQLPVLPELALRWWAHRALASKQRASWPAATLPIDVMHGLELYRANLRPGSRGETVRAALRADGMRTQVPVQLVVPLRDWFITPAATAEVPRFVPHLTRVEVDAGHWVQQTAPDELARLIAAHVHAHLAIGPPPA